MKYYDSLVVHIKKLENLVEKYNVQTNGGLAKAINRKNKFIYRTILKARKIKNKKPEMCPRCGYTFVTGRTNMADIHDWRWTCESRLSKKCKNPFKIKTKTLMDNSKLSFDKIYFFAIASLISDNISKRDLALITGQKTGRVQTKIFRKFLTAKSTVTPSRLNAALSEDKFITAARLILTELFKLKNPVKMRKAGRLVLH